MNNKFEKIEKTLHALAEKGDTVVLTSSMNPRKHINAVRELSWEVALRNPSDPGNFVSFVGKRPDVVRSGIVSYAKRRSSTRIIGYDSDSKLIDNLFDSEVTDLPIMKVPGDVETYMAAVDSLRDHSGTVTHVFDLESLLERDELDKISEHRRPARKPIFRPLCNFHIVDIRDTLHGITNDEELTGNDTDHQAFIYRIDNNLAKILVSQDSQRPRTRQWQELGGYKGVIEFIDLINRYQDRLKTIGFSVPDSEFLPARREDGKFIVVEWVPYLGQDLESIFLGNNTVKKIAKINAMLDASYTVLAAEGIGSDLKPANWVENENGIFHIDVTPPFMRDEYTGQVYTEWPRIEADEIQDFSAETHLTEKAVGYRYYQELCQIDPKNRKLYQEVIMAKLLQWQQEQRIDHQEIMDILEIMNPRASRITTDILRSGRDLQEGFAEIAAEIMQLSQKGKHPIYTLREMSFAISEHMLVTGGNIGEACQQGLGIVEEQLGTEKADQIAHAIQGVPNDTRFLTIVRKLTSLSNSHWKVDQNDRTALDVLEYTVAKLAHG